MTEQPKLQQDKATAANYFNTKNLALTGIAIIVSGFFFLPIVVLVIAGLIPAVIASIIDDDKHRSLTTCVFLSNMAGIIPFAVELAKDGFDMSESLMILAQPLVWLGILVAAAVGWGLFLFIPPIIVKGIKAKARMKISRLELKQRKLMEIWGEEVMPLAYQEQQKQQKAS